MVKGGTIKQMRKYFSMKKFKEGSNIFCKMFDKRRIKFLNFMPIRGNFTIFPNFGPETFLFSGMLWMLQGNTHVGIHHTIFL